MPASRTVRSTSSASARSVGQRIAIDVAEPSSDPATAAAVMTANAPVTCTLCGVSSTETVVPDVGWITHCDRERFHALRRELEEVLLKNRAVLTL